MISYFAIWKSRDPTGRSNCKQSTFLVNKIKVNIEGTRDFHIVHKKKVLLFRDMEIARPYRNMGIAKNQLF